MHPPPPGNRRCEFFPRYRTGESGGGGYLLGPLLERLGGTNIDLSVLNSSGLAQTQINLGQLMVAAGVTNLNDLLTLQTNRPVR